LRDRENEQQCAELLATGSIRPVYPLSVWTAISMKAQIVGLGQRQGCGRVGMRFARGVEAFLEKTAIAYRPNCRKRPNFGGFQ